MTDAPGTAEDLPASTAARRQRGIGPFSSRHLLTILGVVVGAGLVLALVTTPVGAPLPPTARPGATQFVIGPPIEGLRVGDLAPELAGTVDGKPIGLVDLDGSPVTLAALRGHPVWINFWASWCGPCQEETPVLRSVFRTHREQGLIVLGISVQESSPEDVRAYARTYGLDYGIAFDATSAVFKTYRVPGLPTQFFLDGDGIIRDIENGPLTELRAEQILAPLLAGVPGPTPSPTPAGPTSGMTSR